MHLRKLVPLMELLEGGDGGAPARSAVAPTSSKLAPTSSTLAPTRSRLAPTSDSPVPTSNKLAPAESKLAPTSDTVAPTRNVVPPVVSKATTVSASAKPESDTVAPASGGGLKDKFLAEIRSSKNTLYSLAVAQAQRIDVTDDRITFTFAANQNVARMQLDSNKEWLEGVAQRLTGRRIQVTSAQMQAADAAPASSAAPSGASSAPKRDLKEEARSSPSIQAMLDVFPADIRDVEEF